MDVGEWPPDRTCPPPADSLTHMESRCAETQAAVWLPARVSLLAKLCLRWWGTHRPITLFCGLWKVICARGRVCVGVFALCLHTYTPQQASENNWESGFIVVTSLFECFVLCLWLSLCVCILHAALPPYVCMPTGMWVFMYVCGLCKMRMFPRRWLMYRSLSKPGEQNVPGRVQAVSESRALQKPWCVLIAALWKEAWGCGFLWCSSKITEQLSTKADTRLAEGSDGGIYLLQSGSAETAFNRGALFTAWRLCLVVYRGKQWDVHVSRSQLSSLLAHRRLQVSFRFYVLS